MIDIDGAVRILQASGHMASAQRIMALYNDIERQSELIAALRNEIARKDKRIAELEAENESLQESLDGKGLGMWEVVAMKDRALEEYAQIVAELKAAAESRTYSVVDGRTYSEGCTP